MSTVIKISGIENSLKVSAEVWRAALEKAQPDPVAGIRHGAICGNECYRLHVAEIPKKVTCHFHTHGQEVYEVMEGSGILHYGQVGRIASGHSVAWLEPLKVTTGDTFTIPEGFAHQLMRTGSSPLTIIFACPDTHLGDDRFTVDDALT